MRILIQASPIGPLNVLRDLPDARLAVLEGLNGIGKTLAVRLLQICTGTVPYRAKSPAWLSLCSGLGEFAIEVSELAGGHRIRWEADSRDWTDVEIDREPIPFRHRTIDGSPATVEEVRSLFTVYRLGGEETLIEVLAQQPDAAAETLLRWRRRYADEQAGPLAHLEDLLGDSARLLGEQTSSRFADLTEQLDTSAARTATSAQAVERARQRRAALGTAVELKQRVRDIHDRAPDLAERITSLDSDIQRVEAEREALQQQIRTLAERVATNQPLQRTLRNARKTAETRRNELSAQLNSAAVLAGQLEVAPDSAGSLRLVAGLERRGAELEARRAELDTAPSMRHVLDLMLSELSEAQSQGLGSQIAVEDPADRFELTIDETHSGMSTQRSFLEGRPPPPETEEIAAQIAELTQSLARARRLRSTLIEAERLRRLVATNEARVADALAQINPTASMQLRQLEAERGSANDRLLELAAERAALAQQLGGIGDPVTESALTAQLASALTQLTITESDVESTFAKAESDVETALTDLAVDREREGAARRDLSRAVLEIRRANSALRTDPSLGWLRDRLPSGSLALDSAPPLQQLAALDLARDLADRTNERLAGMRSQLGAMEAALRDVARSLRGLDSVAEQYVPQLGEWFSAHFAGWFNAPRIREQLFPEAESSGVSVSIARREVTWSQAGKPLSRPLEAFSSGQQAFAYTKARLAALDEEEAGSTNRLIVLDEFGAFVAHDRLTDLKSYLSSRAAEHPHDQVLIMLPLGRDYAEEAKNAFGEDQKRFEDLAAQVVAQHYAVQVLEK